jgi:hypothetical protein
LGFLAAVFVDGNGGGLRAHPAAIPRAPNLIAWDDLSKATGFDVPHFNEAGIEEKDVWSVERNTFGGAFPLNSAYGSAGVSVFVDVQAKLIVTKEELLLG